MKSKNLNREIRTHQSARGRVRCQVVDGKTGKVKRDYGWQKNLILNQGMNGIGSTRSWADSFTNAVAGTGTTPTQDDSAGTTASQSGTTVTLSGGSFVFTNTGNDAGKMIKWDTNEEARVVSVTSPTVVEVANSATVAAAEFTVFRTNQTGLTTEVKRSSAYVSGAGNNDTTFTAATGVMVMKRTIDFTIEVGSVSYTEVGFSHVATVAANLFSRILLSAPIALVADDQFRVIYELTVTLGYASPQAITPTITGWASTDGDQMIEHFGLDYVSTTGSTTANATWINSVHRTSGVRFLVSNSTAALATEPSSATNPATNRNGTTLFTKLATNDAYTTLTFTRTRSVVLLAAEGVMADLRSIAMVYYSGSGSTYYVNAAMLFDVNQEKLNTHTLSLTWVYSWSRVLA